MSERDEVKLQRAEVYAASIDAEDIRNVSAGSQNISAEDLVQKNFLKYTRQGKSEYAESMQD